MDFYLDWQGDLMVTPSGSIQTAVGWDQTRQRIIRSLCTNSAQELPDGTFTTADYIFEPSFGIGLGKLVDEAANSDFFGALEQRIQAAVLADQDVSSSVPPSVQFNWINSETLQILIGVTLITGEPGQIALNVS